MAAANPFQAFGALRTLPRVVWINVTAAFVNRLGTMALPFYSLFLIRERGYAATEAGALLAVYGLVALVAGPLSGRLSDLFGSQRVMRLSFVTTGVVVMGFPFVHSPGALMALTMLWSLCNEIFRPANLTYLASAVDASQRKQAFAFNRFAINLGMSVGPAVGGMLAQLSFRWIFLVDGLTSLLAAAVLTMQPLQPRPEEQAERTGFDLGKILPLEPLKDSRLVLALLALLPISTLFFQIDSTLSLVVVQYLHLQYAQFGLLATVNTLIIVFTEIPLNHAMASWPHRRTLIIGALITGAGFASIGLAHGFWMLVFSTVLWTIGEMIVSPASSAYVAELAPEKRRGEYMGLYMMTWSLAFTFGPWLGMQLLARLGPHLVWPVLGGLGIVGALGFARAHKDREPAQPAPAAG